MVGKKEWNPPHLVSILVNNMMDVDNIDNTHIFFI